jgi:hypothetical protein
MENKEFEALNELEEELKWAHNDGVTLTKYDEKRFNVIKQALLELKAIKEAKPSEALEDSLKLYKMVESAGNGKGFDLVEAWKYHDTIKQALTTKSKKEQALEIIVKKIWRLKDHKKCIYGTYENYVSDFKRRYEGNLTRYRKYELTQEEYDLLKEVSKDED